MKTKLAVLLTCLCNVCWSQDYYQKYYKLQPTLFDSFIQSPRITWALRINANYILKEDSFNLWNYLYDEWNAGSLEIYARNSLKEYQLIDNAHIASSVDTLKQIFNPVAVNVMTDSLKYIQADQIFYIKDNKLKSAIISASIALPYALQTGQIIRFGPAFYSCINGSVQNKVVSDSMIDLGIHSCKLGFKDEGFSMINLNISNRSDFSDQTEIKRMYNHSLPDILWDLVLRDKLDLYNIEDKPIAAEALEAYPFYEDYPEVKFDDKGNIIDTVWIKRTLTPGSITSIDVVQQFYFDKRKEALFSTVSLIYLYSRNVDNFKWGEEEVCIGKIEFN